VHGQISTMETECPEGGTCSFGLCSSCSPSLLFDLWPAGFSETLGFFAVRVSLEPSSGLRLCVGWTEGRGPL